jgi:hypothetical protein
MGLFGNGERGGKRVCFTTRTATGVLYEGDKGDFKKTPRFGWTFRGNTAYSLAETGVFILDKFGVSLRLYHGRSRAP